MLAKLAGIIDSFESNAVIVMVGGIGMRVLVPARALQTLGVPGDPVQLVTELVVREESLTLYGFKTAADLQWFKLLTSVQGVGPRSALSILSVCPPDRLQLAIASQDKAAITQADGVGPKLAVRILTELKDKSVTLGIPVPSGSVNASVPANAGKDSQPPMDGILIDAVSALTNLGYGRSEAHQAVLKVMAANDADVGSVIRLALKELGKGA